MQQDEELAQAIMDNTRRYNLLVSEAVEDLLPDYKTKEVPSKNALDVFIKHRQMATARAQEGTAPGLQQPAGKTLPPELMRRYKVYFKAPSAEKILPIREVKAQKIGKLVSIRGIITKELTVKNPVETHEGGLGQDDPENKQKVEEAYGAAAKILD